MLGNTCRMSDEARLITGLTQAWRDEHCSARNYRALAEQEANPERKAILFKLAEAEDKHAANWATRLKELGADPGNYEESPKERARRWLLAQRGTEAAVVELEKRERDADALYDDLLKICTDKDRTQIREAQQEEHEQRDDGHHGQRREQAADDVAGHGRGSRFMFLSPLGERER